MLDRKQGCDIMVWNKQIQLPIILENQYLESSPTPSSKPSCWRMLLRWRYCLATKELPFVQLLHYRTLLGTIICVAFLVLSSNNMNMLNAITQPGSQNKSVMYHNTLEELRDSEQSVYSEISSWQLDMVNGDTQKLPILSSLRDRTWLEYDKNEIFSWEEPHLDFVHEALKDNTGEKWGSNNDAHGPGDSGSVVHRACRVHCFRRLSCYRSSFLVHCSSLIVYCLLISDIGHR